jgi:hypothetical protein
MLGYMYRYGQGLPQDFGLALQWYHRAAEQGDAKAQNNLGVMYRRGLGTPQDFQEALRLFRRSADQGDGGGQNHLGLMYYKGEGVPRDYVQAYMWASLAANQGLDQALQALPMLENEMTPAQIEEGKRLAKEWSQRKNKVEL